MCVCVGGCHICGYLWKLDVKSPGAWVTGSDGMPDMGTGNWTQVLSKNNMHSEPLPSPQPVSFLMESAVYPWTQYHLREDTVFPMIQAFLSFLALCSLETIVCFLPAAPHLNQESWNFKEVGLRWPSLSSQQALGFFASQFTFCSKTKPPHQRHM